MSQFMSVMVIKILGNKDMMFFNFKILAFVLKLVSLIKCFILLTAEHNI